MIGSHVERLLESLLGSSVVLVHIVDVGRVEHHLGIILVADEPQYVQLYSRLLMSSLLNHRECIGQNHVVAFLLGKLVGVHLLHVHQHLGIVALRIAAQQCQRLHAVQLRCVGVLLQVLLNRLSRRLRVAVIGDAGLHCRHLMLLCVCEVVLHHLVQQFSCHVIAVFGAEQFSLLQQSFGVPHLAVHSLHILGLPRECRASQQQYRKFSHFLQNVLSFGMQRYE